MGLCICALWQQNYNHTHDSRLGTYVPSWGIPRWAVQKQTTMCVYIIASITSHCYLILKWMAKCSVSGYTYGTTQTQRREH